MKILAIDTSGEAASAAVMEDEKITACYSINYKKTHSQTIVPMMDEMAKMISLDLSSVDAVAVTSGPGSFTGLRIGGATAKGLGLALDKPLIAVPTLEGIAYSGWGFDGLICPVLDARRDRFYTALYRYQDQDIRVVEDQHIAAAGDLIADLNGRGGKVLFAGDGTDLFRDKFSSELTVNAVFEAPHLKALSASAVAVCAMKYLKKGRTTPADAFVPVYLSLSQAERERNARLKEAEEKKKTGQMQN